MDSTVYTYLVEEIRSRPDPGFSSLPSLFVKSRPSLSTDGFAGLKLFIKSVPDGGAGCGARQSGANNFFSRLFGEAHHALLDILGGQEPATHPFRHNGAQLARFLSLCASSGTPMFVRPADIPYQAMFCFLLEGLIHAGWCPGAFEGTAKRAAHAWFATLKKNFHFLQPGSAAAVLGYLWGAWLLAQKTEGIRDTAPGSFACTETFEWQAAGERRVYTVLPQNKTQGFRFFAHYAPGKIPHPNRLMQSDSATGLFLSVDNEPVLPEALLECSTILRQKVSGCKLVFSCGTPVFTGIRWTAVFLFLESTTYRIDILALPKPHALIGIQAELCIENESPLEETALDNYLGKGPVNDVVRLVENPMGFTLTRQDGDGISRFTSNSGKTSYGATLTTVTAWARGTGITTVHELKLLGIFE